MQAENETHRQFLQNLTWPKAPAYKPEKKAALILKHAQAIKKSLVKRMGITVDDTENDTKIDILTIIPPPSSSSNKNQEEKQTNPETKKQLDKKESLRQKYLTEITRAEAAKATLEQKIVQLKKLLLDLDNDQAQAQKNAEKRKKMKERKAKKKEQQQAEAPKKRKRNTDKYDKEKRKKMKLSEM